MFGASRRDLESAARHGRVNEDRVSNPASRVAKSATGRRWPKSIHNSLCNWRVSARHLCYVYRVSYDRDVDPAVNGSYVAIAARAAAFMRAHLADPLTTAAVAGAVGVSPRTLHRAMCAFAGMSPSRALALMRVAEAERLLADGVKVDVVALSVGFRSRASLYRPFLKLADCRLTECRSRGDLVVPGAMEAGTPLAGGGTTCIPSLRSQFDGPRGVDDERD
jgi:AraC-like DNA-binding protein